LIKKSSLFIKNQAPVSKYSKRDGSLHNRPLRLCNPRRRMLQMLKICMGSGGNWIHSWNTHTHMPLSKEKSCLAQEVPELKIMVFT